MTKPPLRFRRIGQSPGFQRVRGAEGDPAMPSRALAGPAICGLKKRQETRQVFRVGIVSVGRFVASRFVAPVFETVNLGLTLGLVIRILAATVNFPDDPAVLARFSLAGRPLKWVTSGSITFGEAVICVCGHAFTFDYIQITKQNSGVPATSPGQRRTKIARVGNPTCAGPGRTLLPCTDRGSKIPVNRS